MLSISGMKKDSSSHVVAKLPYTSSRDIVKDEWKKITGYGILAAGISGVGIYRNFTFPKLPRLFQPASAVSPLMQKNK